VNRIPVESRTIASAGYDATTSTMEVAFRSGAVYQYFAVPRSIFEGILASDSNGRFFNQHIRDVYPFRKT
jgi:hypothetical protein